MKKSFDKKHQQPIKYELRDLVLVSGYHLPSRRGSRKLDMQWRGPYEILSRKGPTLYELTMPEHWAGHWVFHYKKLKKYAPLPSPNRCRELFPLNPIL